MAQADYDIANAVGAAFGTDLNNHLAAIVSNNSGGSEPGTMFAGQFWVDETDEPWTLKVRSHDSNSWASLFKSDGSMVAAPATHTHSELVASDGSPEPALSVDTVGFVGIGDSSPSRQLDVNAGTANIAARFVSTDANVEIEFLDSTTGANPPSIMIVADDMYLRVGNANRIKVESGGNIGINTASPLAKLHVDQSSTTAAIPVLYLDQADVSEEMIEFNSVIGAGNPIEVVALKTLIPTHFIKCTIPGGFTRYFQVGTLA